MQMEEVNFPTSWC